MKKAINTAGKVAGAPYSVAVDTGQTLYISGQVPLDPATGKLVKGDITVQAEQVMKNLDSALAAAGYCFADVVKATVFLCNMDDFAAMNEVYRKYVSEPYPARSAIGVAALPLGAKVEIEMIAQKST